MTEAYPNTLRRAALDHFAMRCKQRGIPTTATAIADLALKMAPCWRKAGVSRYSLRIRLGGLRAVLTVVWDDDLGVPVTAWWPWNDSDGYADQP